MAETPAAAPANTKDTLLANIKALIKNTFDEEEPRGNNTASLAVHAAMAEAMADVITDCKITQNCAIDQTFVEEWALTQLLMKDKLDHFIRLHLLSTNSPSAYLNKLESRPYQVADIDATITDQPLVPSAVQKGPMRIKMQHNEACAQLKDTLGRLAFILRNEMPAIKAHMQSVEARKQTINSTVPEEYREAAMQVEVQLKESSGSSRTFLFWCRCCSSASSCAAFGTASSFMHSAISFSHRSKSRSDIAVACMFLAIAGDRAAGECRGGCHCSRGASSVTQCGAKRRGAAAARLRASFERGAAAAAAMCW
mmetsp:Transcript_7465/g.19579  ORF Transcript_7465/g.19579 Transcript_7465/m.19579 type:complete len:311 (-) Transcript_7465:879-1811(-)